MVELGPSIPLFSELKFTNHLQGLISDDIMMGLLCKLYLIFGDSVPVQHYKLQLQMNISPTMKLIKMKRKMHLDAVQARVLGFWQVKDKRLVENRVQGSFLDVRFLFHDSLVVEEQIDLDVRICKREIFSFQNSFCAPLIF